MSDEADVLQPTEVAFLRELLTTVKAAEAAYNQYAAFLTRRYQLTERDRLDLDTGAIQRDALAVPATALEPSSALEKVE